MEIAGVAFVAVGAEQPEAHIVAAYLVDSPYLVGKAFGASVEGIGSVVDGQGVFLAVKGKPTAGDAVGIAAGNLAGVGTVVDRFLDAVTAGDNVGETSVAVGDAYPGYGCAGRGQCDRGARGIGKGDEGDIAVAGIVDCSSACHSVAVFCDISLFSKTIYRSAMLW